ncbi:uncharacterized protein LOC120258373 [Dioscorea cayenensis subsp. rotundata]|uniref:Uncharacterized protein LOC120258373 n=1 Tax=Dioscorea cayennensis subsp. rotundata TaxID=55577 RepID=A0AB40B4P8_DIOCR|nr:uncharacterized protein LOC120258373 [Dioscorea cayenensis subsp. rotundata]
MHSMSSEVDDVIMSMPFPRSEVLSPTRQKDKAAVSLVDPGLGFVDPLEKDIGLRVEEGPVDCFKGSGSGSDPVLECDWGANLGRSICSEVDGDHFVLPKGSLLGDSGPGFGPPMKGEGPHVEGVDGSKDDLLIEGVLPDSKHSGGPNIEGVEAQISLGDSGLLLEGVDVLDSNAKPNTAPPMGFEWHFLANIWVLDPIIAPKNANLGVGVGDSYASETEDRDDEFASDDSIYEFERSIKELLPGMKEGSSSPTNHAPKGVRKSDRPKKPSSRWTEEAGYVAEPPRSTKKKVTRDDASEAPIDLRVKMEDHIATIKRSLDFAGPRSVGEEATPMNEVDQASGEE